MTNYASEHLRAERATTDLAVMRDQLREVCRILKQACERAWENENPIQVATILASAIRLARTNAEAMQGQRDYWKGRAQEEVDDDERRMDGLRGDYEAEHEKLKRACDLLRLVLGGKVEASVAFKIKEFLDER